MDRSLLSAVFGSLLGFSSLGLLGYVSTNPSPTPEPPKGDGGWRLLNPITYENISVFPVVATYAADTSHFLTLEEGLASGEVFISEQGATGLVRNRGRDAGPEYSSGASVNQLVLINRSKRPLLLLAGELVSGGKQDRIIGKDRIVPVGAEPLPLDVFCVEHGRWSSGANFSAAKTIVHPSVREQAALKQDQSEVWNAVRNGTTSNAADYAYGAAAGGGISAAPAPRVSTESLSVTVAKEAPTESYDKLYNKSKSIGGNVDSFVDEIHRRFARETSGLKGEHVVGVVIAYGSEVAWSDIFASDDLFAKYWPKLLRSYAVEALARPGYREVASRGDAEEFLSSLKGIIKEETEPGVYRWREIREGRLSQIELDAFDPKPLMLHRLLLHRTS
jgi:ARG/rhodanese/phosphatase superfamily protein